MCGQASQWVYFVTVIYEPVNKCSTEYVVCRWMPENNKVELALKLIYAMPFQNMGDAIHVAKKLACGNDTTSANRAKVVTQVHKQHAHRIGVTSPVPEIGIRHFLGIE